MTVDEKYSLLSALIDREPVDPDALAAVLEEPAGHDLLVSFARLRVEVAREIGLEASVSERMASVTHPRWGRAWRLAAAMLLPLLLGLGGGYWWRQHEANQPPTPTQVVRLVPGVDWK